ncbi:hypothetical protein GIB67_007368 [Kingdonia uniflora]|uniref:DUF8040 domain-containing protein n=1 Tax=Kingdonia uniflora TaxID=39325 RepID=A0A7J7NXB8_9MAGN|nr:hypothetical protein GIB67_007368 [Kingdonia uniflora]
MEMKVMVMYVVAATSVLTEDPVQLELYPTKNVRNDDFQEIVVTHARVQNQSLLFAVVLTSRPHVIRNAKPVYAHYLSLLSGPATNMYNMMTIDPDSFRSLVAHFRETGLLKDNMHIDVEEKLAIFMHIIAHKMSNRAVNSRYEVGGGDNNENVDGELLPNAILSGAAERKASIILRDIIVAELALAHNAQNVNSAPN